MLEVGKANKTDQSIAVIVFTSTILFQCVNYCYMGRINITQLNERFCLFVNFSTHFFPNSLSLTLEVNLLKISIFFFKNSVRSLSN